MMKAIVCASALAACLPAAAAASDTVVQQEVVRFDDLNLGSPAGIKTLERRINAAARRVCNYHDPRGSSYLVPKEVSDCMDNALASARQQVAVKTAGTARKG